MLFLNDQQGEWADYNRPFQNWLWGQAMDLVEFMHEPPRLDDVDGMLTGQ